MEKNDLRKRALEEIKKTSWLPEWGQEKIYQMVANRPDWCISRQRSWGAPITAFYCKGCGEVVASREISDHIADMMEAAGADVWFDKEPVELLPKGTACPKCGGKEFNKETDILDVWFDSGVSYAAVIGDEEISDLYLEGSDQHRGWFHSSLLASVATRNRAPYKTVLTHGYVVDGDGKKMSKSVGNVIPPQKIIDKYGAELLRLWVASENYREDIRLSDEILTRLTDAYRKVRNTFRYILGNLSDFDPQKDMVDYDSLSDLDRYILNRLGILDRQIVEAFNGYQFHVFYHALHNFCSVDLSSFYLDIVKDRLYTLSANSSERRGVQTTLYHLLNCLVRLISPVLAFTAEEVWDFVPGEKEADSVHAVEFFKIPKEWLNEDIASHWKGIIQVRKETSKALEDARRDKVIGHSLNASAEIHLPEDCGLSLADIHEDLSEIFITSDIKISNETTPPAGAFVSEEIKGMWVKVNKAAGEKCERCWRYSETTGKYEEHPTICERCLANLES